MAATEAAIAGASGVISGGLSLLGIPWQQDLQKELMDYNASLNIAQWERENAYNSPAEQMKRLKLAGLNPDLAIAGKVANTSGSVDVSSGTPQAPGAASAVSQAVRNAEQGALVASEIKLNEKTAENQQSQAEEHGANAHFKWETMPASIQQAWATLGFTQQQTMESRARVELFGIQAENFAKNIEKMNREIDLLLQDKRTQVHLTRLTAFNADKAYKELSLYDNILTTKLDNIVSSTGLNDAYAGLLRANAFVTWNSAKSLIQSNQYMARIQRSNAFIAAVGEEMATANQKILDMNLKVMPFTFAGALFQAKKYCEVDKDGNIVLDKDGLPKIRDGYAGMMSFIEQGQGLLNMAESATRSAFNLMSGLGAMKSGMSFNMSTPNNGGFSVNPPKGYREVHSPYGDKTFFVPNN